MTSFLTELQRRNVHRAAMFHAGAAWQLVQVTTRVLPPFDFPGSKDDPRFIDFARKRAILPAATSKP